MSLFRQLIQQHQEETSSQEGTDNNAIANKLRKLFQTQIVQVETKEEEEEEEDEENE